MAIPVCGFGITLRYPKGNAQQGQVYSGCPSVEIHKGSAVVTLAELGTTGYYYTDGVPAGRYTLYVNALNTSMEFAVGAGELAGLGYSANKYLGSTDNAIVWADPPTPALPIATTAALGGVIVGQNLAVDSNGILSALQGGSNYYPVGLNGTGGLQTQLIDCPAGYSLNIDSDSMIALNTPKLLWMQGNVLPSGILRINSGTISAASLALSDLPAITAANVGLGNVTNVAQIPLSYLGAANGVATLNGSGLIPSTQLPSYVDDVLEFANLAALPTTGETGKIYVTIDTNLTYRWTGSIYAEISKSLALGVTSSTAFQGDLGAAAYAHSQLTSANPHATTFAQLASKPTTVSGFGITDITSQLLTGYAVGTNAALANTDTLIGAFNKIQAQINGKQASGSYLTANQPITLSGVVTGSGTTAITTAIADSALSIAKTSGLQAALDGKASLASVAWATTAVTACSNSSKYGQIEITGANNNSWDGINFANSGTILMVDATHMGQYTKSTSSWQWLWNNGTLSVGTVPAANISGTVANATYAVYATGAGSVPVSNVLGCLSSGATTEMAGTTLNFTTSNYAADQVVATCNSKPSTSGNYLVTITMMARSTTASQAVINFTDGAGTSLLPATFQTYLNTLADAKTWAGIVTWGNVGSYPTLTMHLTQAVASTVYSSHIYVSWVRVL